MSSSNQQPSQTYRKSSAGRVVTVTCLPHLARKAESLLETVIGLGAKPGGTIFFGGAPFRLVEHAGELQIRQPDYSADAPLATWVPDVSGSLALLAAQMQLATAAGVEPRDYRLDQTFTALKEAVSDNNFYMQHNEPISDNDSGWYLGSAEVGKGGEPTPSDYGVAPLYALFQMRPVALLVLPLPTGYLARFEGDSLVGVANEKNEEVYKRP